MISIYDGPSRTAALGQQLDPSLTTLITARLAKADEAGLTDLTHVLVIQSGDEESAVAAEIGFSPLVSPIEGTRFGSPKFIPYWPWLQDLGGWYEMIVTVGNSGFAFVLLIQDAPGNMPELLELCATYAGGGLCE